MLAGLGPGEGQEASGLGSWYQSPSNSRTTGVLVVGRPKSQLRSPHFPGVGMKSQRGEEETVHGSTEEDQVKDGHIAKGALEVPALWWELVSVPATGIRSTVFAIFRVRSMMSKQRN